MPWKQLSRNFRAFPHHRCCWFLTEGSDRVLLTLALVFHSHGRESLHLCFCLDLGLSLGLCVFGREIPTTSATTKGNESHTKNATDRSPPLLLVQVLVGWQRFGDFFFFYLGLKGGVWVWSSVDLWVFFIFFFWILSENWSNMVFLLEYEWLWICLYALWSEIFGGFKVLYG